MLNGVGWKGISGLLVCVETMAFKYVLERIEKGRCRHLSLFVLAKVARILTSSKRRPLDWDPVRGQSTVVPRSSIEK